MMLIDFLKKIILVFLSFSAMGMQELSTNNITVAKLPTEIKNQLSFLKIKTSNYRSVVEELKDNIEEDEVFLNVINYASVNINFYMKNNFWEKHDHNLIFSNAKLEQYGKIQYFINQKNLLNKLLPSLSNIGRLCNDIIIKAGDIKIFGKNDKLPNTQNRVLKEELQKLSTNPDIKFDANERGYLTITNNGINAIELNLSNLIETYCVNENFQIPDPNIIREIFYENAAINKDSVFHAEANTMAWLYRFLKEKLQKEANINGVVVSLYTEQSACDPCEHIITAVLKKIQKIFLAQGRNIFLFPVIGYHKHTESKKYVVNQQIISSESNSIDHLGKELLFDDSSTRPELLVAYDEKLQLYKIVSIFDNIMNPDNLNKICVSKWGTDNIIHNEQIKDRLQNKNRFLLEAVNSKLTRLPIQIRINNN